MARRSRIESGFNLGGEQAEADPLLEHAFFDAAAFKAIESVRDRKCFLIGRTGGGKSAFLQRLEEIKPDHTIRINPEDLSLPYLLDLGVVQRLSELGVHLDPFFIALWKHVLIVEVIKHRYRVDSPVAKQTFLDTLRQKIRRDRSKQLALDYLDEFGESFWCETDERVKEVTEQFTSRLSASGGLTIPLPHMPPLGAQGESTRSTSAQVRLEQVDRYQRVVNETQLPRLNKMIAVLGDDILESEQNFTYVLIDDLDRDWVDEQLGNDLIRCLFRAVLDLQKVRKLKIVVALRTNIFDHLNFGSRAGGQEEKFRALSLRVRWTKRELAQLADVRVRAAASLATWDGPFGLENLLPPRSKRGDPFDFVLQRTLMRPRDVIAFMNECLSRAVGKPRCSWEDLQSAEGEYSGSRLMALRDEWKPTFPGIDQVFRSFTGVRRQMNRGTFSRVLDDCVLLLSDPEFPGVSWMTELSQPLWSGLDLSEWTDLYQPLTKLLYDIGFIGVVDAKERMHFAHTGSGYADRPSNLNETAQFMVHPAFRKALDIR